MDRRNFVTTTTAASIAICVPILCSCAVDDDVVLTLSNPKSLSQIWDAKTINTIGIAYRSIHANEKNKRTLINAIYKNRNKKTVDLEKDLMDSITKDFNTGNTLMIDGWVLSQTEARQCALFSLTHSK